MIYGIALLSGSLNRQNVKSVTIPIVCMVGARGMVGESVQNG